jgi:hypothetical protein
MFHTSFTTISGSLVPLPASTDANGMLVTTDAPTDSGSGLSTGAIIGLAVGIPIGVIALAGFATFAAVKLFGKPAFLKKLFSKSSHSGNARGSGGNENVFDDGYPSYKPMGQDPPTEDLYRGWTTNVPQMTQTGPGHNPAFKAHNNTKSAVIHNVSEALQNHALSATQQELSAANPFQTANAAANGMDSVNAASESATGQSGTSQQAPGQSGPTATGFEQQFTLDQLSPSQLQQYGLDHLPFDQLQHMGLDNLSPDQLQQLDWDLSQFDPTNSNNQGPDFDLDRDQIEKLRRYIGKLREKIDRRRRRRQSQQELYAAPSHSPSY